MGAPVARSLTLLASAARSATNSTDVQLNGTGHRGVYVTIDATVIASTETVTPKVEFQDPASGKWVALVTGAAISAAGTVTLKVYPGITASANVAVSDVLPSAWRVTLTHSASGAHTYSVGAQLLP